MCQPSRHRRPPWMPLRIPLPLSLPHLVPVPVLLSIGIRPPSRRVPSMPTTPSYPRHFRLTWIPLLTMPAGTSANIALRGRTHDNEPLAEHCVDPCEHPGPADSRRHVRCGDGRRLHHHDGGSDAGIADRFSSTTCRYDAPCHCRRRAALSPDPTGGR